MSNTDDYMYVQGNVVFDSAQNNGSTFDDGTLQIDGNFTQISNNNSASFQPNTNHKVILSGTNKQTVSFASTSSYFNKLDINNFHFSFADNHR